MIIEEAAWIRRILEEQRPREILDCGSSSEVYRRHLQPFIDGQVFAELNVTHLDVAAGPGVDLVADICETPDLPQFGLVVCASLLEHVRDHRLALRNVCHAVREHLILTVPNRWPLHGGYDNGYRPTLGALCQSVEEWGLVVQRAELLHGSGAYVGRRIGILHALRE